MRTPGNLWTVWSTVNTQLWWQISGRDSNPVPLSFEPQPYRMSHRGGPVRAELILADIQRTIVWGPARNHRRYTGLNLNSTRPPLTWSPSYIEKGETMLFLWKLHTGTAGFETGTHAWLAKQSGTLAIAPRPLFKELLMKQMPLCSRWINCEEKCNPV